MKSLHVITRTSRRGAETFAVELIEALRMLGDNATVTAPNASEENSEHEVEVLGPSRRHRHALNGRQLRAGFCDIVIAHRSSTPDARAFALAGSGISSALLSERRSVASPAQHEEARRRLGVYTRQPCLECFGALSPNRNAGTAIEVAEEPSGRLPLVAQGIEAHGGCRCIR